MVRLSAGILFYLFIATAGAGEKPSLKLLQRDFKDGPEITAEIKKPHVNPAQLSKFLNDNKNLRAHFADLVRTSSAFVRGEIENETTLNFVINFMQLSILKIRLDISEKHEKEVAEEVQTWFNFAADLAYEESTLVGLRLASVIRSLMLDELEAHIKKNPGFFVSAGPWVKTLRAPWPVDRVFLFESRRVLKTSELKIAEKAAGAFQKNPYQTAEQILNKIPGGKTKNLEFLKSIWRESDLRAMKTEVNRLGILRAQVAYVRFNEQQKKPAAGWDDLKKSAGLDQVPIDYFTGRPMEWSQLAAAVAETRSQSQ